MFLYFNIFGTKVINQNINTSVNFGKQREGDESKDSSSPSFSLRKTRYDKMV